MGWKEILAGASGKQKVINKMASGWENLKAELAYKEGMEQPLPTFTYEESLSEAQQRASPIIQALSAREEYLKPIVSAEAFAPVAERGFGSSGIAETEVGRALADLRFGMEEKQQSALTEALNQIQREQETEFNQAVQQKQLLQTEASNRYAREAQEDKGLFS